MESAAGAFVAGRPNEKVTPENVPKQDPRPPSTETFDSAWRLDASNLHELKFVPPNVGAEMSQPKNVIEVPQSVVAEPVPKAEPVDSQPAETKEAEVGPEDKKVSTASDDLKNCAKPGSVENMDDIPLGFSPGSPVPSSAAPSTNKFDKFYHQSLVST